MKLFLINYISLILTILNVFTNKVDAQFTVADLAVCCALSNGTTTISKIPPGCTALAHSTFDAGTMTAMSLIKGTVPLMVIDDTTFLDQWADVVENSATAYITTFQGAGVDVIAFDNMYEKDTFYSNSEFSNNIAAFIDDAKCNFPKMLFGIAFNADTDFTQSSVDVNVLNDHVDFYLLKSSTYRNCSTYEDHQDEMANVATREDICNTIGKFKDTGMDVTKLIYSMEIMIYSIKQKMEHFNYLLDGESMSYSELCSKKVSKNRKFCFDSIQCFFEKARIRQDEDLLGVYIDRVENDDVNGTCECIGKEGAVDRFKAVSIIAAASQNSSVTVDDLQCKGGEFPVIRR